ncbi:MAG TPA: DUF2520 domain-containing protein [Terriglobia bacterium]|nr:DUF2520 domain-containing protein [Terriglobia bacterium]
MSQPLEGIAIVGPGRAGQALGTLLAAAGFPIRYVAARRPAAARAAVRFIGAGRPVPIDSPELAEARIILITTSDAAIEPVARALAALRRSWRGRIVLHTCGSLPGSGPGSPLARLERLGASTGSFHPFQTVPNAAAGVVSLVGSYWGIDGRPAAVKVARRWAKALGGVAFAVKPGRKTLYHVSAFLVSPTLVTLLEQSERLLKLAGVPRKVARPMLARFVAETVKSVAEMGPRRALTGPAARGDWETLRRHLEALRRHAPEVIPVYVALARAMVRLTGKNPPRGLL